MSYNNTRSGYFRILVNDVSRARDPVWLGCATIRENQHSCAMASGVIPLATLLDSLLQKSYHELTVLAEL